MAAVLYDHSDCMHAFLVKYSSPFLLWIPLELSVRRGIFSYAYCGLRSVIFSSDMRVFYFFRFCFSHSWTLKSCILSRLGGCLNKLLYCTPFMIPNISTDQIIHILSSNVLNIFILYIMCFTAVHCLHIIYWCVTCRLRSSYLLHCRLSLKKYDGPLKGCLLYCTTTRNHRVPLITDIFASF